MATMIDPDLDTLLGLEFAPPCENVSRADEACDNAAEWSLVLGCCGAVILYCSYHKDLLLGYLDDYRGELVHSEDAGGCEKRIKIMSIEPL